MKTSQVFVSRTSDMAKFPAGRSFVQAVLDAVNRAGLAAVDMGYFAARDGQPADYCRQRVRDCEIYVAVVGFRYGSLVSGETCGARKVGSGYAAWVYSLISPPRIGRRRTRCVSRSAGRDGGFGGRWSRA